MSKGVKFVYVEYTGKQAFRLGLYGEITPGTKVCITESDFKFMRDAKEPTLEMFKVLKEGTEYIERVVPAPVEEKPADDKPEPVNYSKKTTAELKELCAAKGIPIPDKGGKATLVELLTAESTAGDGTPDGEEGTQGAPTEGQ